ncbi:ABC transporter permease [Sphingobacterium phlebotomi]|uniref:ABC transporter permease n=1 Tax=Sphingobacterium phlebotomi TaxID=2605433 RepID=A0A5D4GZ19_9SPHI|nr:ABC transporter permease [Sphingobacterium phlebotomi]TYR33648.1 ABC transporter permease [Sphingobacterium phlebotomi]
MHKILLIINREYFSRVKKKSFLLVTFFVPMLFIGMYAGIFFLTKQSYEDTHAIIHIVDDEGSISPQLKNNKNITYSLSNTDLQNQIKNLKNGAKNTNLLIIPADFYTARKIELLSSGKPNIATQNEVRSQLREIIRNEQYRKMGLNVDSIRNINDSIQIAAKEVTETGDAKDSHTEVAMGIAMGLCFLIYLSLVLFGTQVMRGVIEEKSNRIVEVVISSVKPFQLMMGKIIGIGMVGITQFVLWILLSLTLMTVFSTALFSDKEMAQQAMGRNMTELPGEQAATANADFDWTAALDSVNFTELTICFFVFFLGGYLLYSALFAAVGSAVDNETEAGQFTMPITMPLLIPYILSFGVLINDPHGSIATWLSMIPFTSPVAMLVRIPFGVPTWQIVLSAVLLIGGFVLTTWFAARIYRVGILMYGKKASLKELIKWFSYKR